MGQKIVASTIYLKDGLAVRGPECLDDTIDAVKLANHYNDSGVDKLIIMDLSDDDDEHEKNLMAIREINNNSEVKSCAGGNIKRLEDVKKYIYAGCQEVILNGSKHNTAELMIEAANRFGKEKIIVSIENMDFVFKYGDKLDSYVNEILILNKKVLDFDGFEGSTDLPYIVYVDDYEEDYLVRLLTSRQIRGISGTLVSNKYCYDIMGLKSKLSDKGVKFDNFEPLLKWNDLTPNDKGLIPVIVQEYITKDVLMLAYMNEESFKATIRTGKMTYYSRSRKKLWMKGETSGHIQYVKKLIADCDKDTILAFVSQAGDIACHTGSRSCFFNEIITKEYIEKNPLKIFETLYDIIVDRRDNPKEGSYTNYLFDKGIDKILKKVGEEATEIVIAAKNPNKEEIKYEIADFLYHVMVLMVECDITWDEVTRELSRR
ncbi:MAG: bifunctional phosphoribosyl-AMP cyclohydrolase/phosphoribosyl-ATP diphosphatase HisIE [Lachnospiraceae bacterium]|nr:bifunctional phosphoribosyl-AMP cyclohydrolase/phosphoribosyl-ATP diphosphatase HisIE [Lachnospiraceae bacterium]